MYFPPKYQVYEKLGEGGFGSVYKASYKDKDRVLALKVVKPKTPGQLDSVENEIDVLQNLSCIPSLVCYYGSQRVDDPLSLNNGNTFYIEMEYIQGKDLRRFAKEHQTDNNLSRYMMSIMADLMSGIIYIHDHGLIHRDIKPENIMIKYPEMQPKLIDFGLACVSEQRQKCLNQECCIGKSGTPYFMAPETLLDGLSYPKSDIWSLGASVYTAITGFNVFNPKPQTVVMLRRLAVNSPELIPTGDYQLDELLEMMLEKNVKSRISASQVLGYLNSRK